MCSEASSTPVCFSGSLPALSAAGAHSAAAPARPPLLPASAGPHCGGLAHLQPPPEERVCQPRRLPARALPGLVGGVLAQLLMQHQGMRAPPGMFAEQQRLPVRPFKSLLQPVAAAEALPLALGGSLPLSSPSLLPSPAPFPNAARSPARGGQGAALLLHWLWRRAARLHGPELCLPAGGRGQPKELVVLPPAAGSGCTGFCSPANSQDVPAPPVFCSRGAATPRGVAAAHINARGTRARHTPGPTPPRRPARPAAGQDHLEPAAARL